MNLAVAILAAGSGTRMKSKLSKVLHSVAGSPMLSYVIDEAFTLNPSRVIVVVPKDSSEIKENTSADVEYAVQEEQLGTAHALEQATNKLEDFDGNVLVLYGDTPLIKGESLTSLIKYHQESNSVATVVTAKLKNPFGYGRIIRADNRIVRIVEEKDANEDEKKIDEINSGMYVFNSKSLFEKLSKVEANNKQKEYYLTDVIGMSVAEGEKVAGFELGAEEIFGINSRAELARASKIMNKRIILNWLDNQVTIIDPDSTYIEKSVKIGADSIIHPHTFLEGETKLGSNCEIGPMTQIKNSTVGSGSKVRFSVVDEASIALGASVGPYSHIRPGTVVENNAKVGAFSEVKKSRIGAGSKVPHLSYIGDSEIEEDVNIGAGSITCNYDGKNKYKTTIKKGAFIGSDTMFVAPVTIGKNATTGAGSVITEDIPDDALGLERTKQKNVANYKKKPKDS